MHHSFEFDCQNCQKTFKSKAERQRHQLVHNNERRFLCDQCPSSFKLKWHLLSHLRTQHRSISPRQSSTASSGNYGCSICGKRFARWQDLVRHIPRVRAHEKYLLANGPYFCGQLSNETSSKCFICSWCSQRFTRWQDLTRHIAGSCPKPKPKRFFGNKPRCSHCNSDFETLRKLNQHRLVQGLKPQKPAFNCNICPVSFTTVSALGKHVAAHAPGRMSYRCGHCQLAFASFRHLRIHMMDSHGMEVDLDCQVCGKRFRKNYDLQTHLRAHSHLRPFRSRECPMAFKFPQSLRVHESSVRPCCSSCNAVFRQLSQLRWHVIRMHPDASQQQVASQQPPANYVCSRCDAVAFIGVQGLVRHIRDVHACGTDLPEIRYKCSKCAATFKRRDVMKRHEARHSRSRRSHTCWHCDEVVLGDSRFLHHLLSRHGQPFYGCCRCEKAAFPTATRLMFHFKIVHGKDAQRRVSPLLAIGERQVSKLQRERGRNTNRNLSPQRQKISDSRRNSPRRTVSKGVLQVRRARGRSTKHSASLPQRQLQVSPSVSCIGGASPDEASSLPSHGKRQLRNEPSSSPASSSHAARSSLTSRGTSGAPNLKRRGRPPKVGGSGQKLHALLVQPRGIMEAAHLKAGQNSSSAPKLRSRGKPSKTKSDEPTFQASSRERHSLSASAASKASTPRASGMQRKRSESTLTNKQARLRREHSSTSGIASLEDSSSRCIVASTNKTKLSLSLRDVGQGAPRKRK